MKDKEHIKAYLKLAKEIETQHKMSLEEYFLGKDPRKTKYYKQMMKGGKK